MFQLFSDHFQVVNSIRLSAFEVKNNSCLFERLFKVKKNGVFLFRISFFVLEIFTSLYYANEESDDVIDRSTKTVPHSIKNISGNIKAVIFKLGTRNVHYKRKRRHARRARVIFCALKGFGDSRIKSMTCKMFY